MSAREVAGRVAGIAFGVLLVTWAPNGWILAAGVLSLILAVVTP